MAFQGDSIFWVEVEKIVPNPFQPRREFNQEKLQELADSIRMYGVLQPLTVTRKEVHREDGTFYTEYELIAGERRLRASKLAKVDQVPVIIRSGEQTEQEKLELAIIENLQREDLNAVDRALAFKQLADVFNLSITQVAKKVGRSREYVSNSIRLLGLPDHILDSVKTGDITEGHGRTLLMLKDKPEELEVIYREILLKKLSVREVERIARKIATDKVRKKSWANTDAHLIEMEREFTDTLGTRVQISKTDFGGKLTIDYFTESELEKLLHVIKSQRTLLESATDEDVVGPVIQELAQAESNLAALTKATPLQAVDTSTPQTWQHPEPVQVVPESPVTSVPSQEPTTAAVPESAPEPAYSEAPLEQPAQESSVVAAQSEQSVVTTPQPAVQSMPMPSVESVTPVPEVAAVQPVVPTPEPQPVPNAPEPVAATESSEPTQSVSAQPEQPTSYTAAGYQGQAAAAAQPAPAPRTKPQVVATFNDRKSFVMAAVPTATPAAQPQPQPTTPAPVEPPAWSEPPVATAPADPQTEKPSSVDDSDDLYSINRFSI